MYTLFLKRKSPNFSRVLLHDLPKYKAVRKQKRVPSRVFTIAPAIITLHFSLLKRQNFIGEQPFQHLVSTFTVTGKCDIANRTSNSQRNNHCSMKLIIYAPQPVEILMRTCPNLTLRYNGFVCSNMFNTASYNLFKTVVSYLYMKKFTITALKETFVLCGDKAKEKSDLYLQRKKAKDSRACAKYSPL